MSETTEKRQDTFTMQLKQSFGEDSAGFTLLELLTTLTIVGILSAIVSHQFHAYTLRAMSARAESDLRAVVTAEEAFYTGNEHYVSCTNTACDTVLTGYRLSVDIQLSVVTRDGDQNFDATSYHPKGDKTFSYSSDGGTFTWVPR